MRDQWQREINYLRVSVTDRCNLRCRYCMPEEGVVWKRHEEIMSYEEIAHLVALFSRAGIRKVRLTGGEPLTRRDLPRLVAMLKEIDAIDDISLTTNGVLLPQLGRDLKAAGLNRVNISLDTLRREKYRQLCGRDELPRVLAAIDEALKLELHPVKLNSVIIAGVNEDEIEDLAALTLDRPLHLRYIELMPMKGRGEKIGEAVTSGEIRRRLEEKYGPLIPAGPPRGQGPAKYFRIAGACGTVGFIDPISHHFCPSCNRLRLTADGRLRPCLAAEMEIDVLTPLRQGAGEEEILALYYRALQVKPISHGMDGKWDLRGRSMHQIGG